MTSRLARYVLTLSAGSAESLNAYAHGLATFLSGGQRAFPLTATLPGIAATLLNFRRCAPHRLAFSAATTAEVAEKLIAFTEDDSNPKSLASQGLYANVIHWSAFDDAVESADSNYLLELAAGERHDQLAKLWSVGFPVDWRAVYPELTAERPVHLPPVPLHRRRYWPETGPDAPPEQPAAPEPAAAATTSPQLITELTGLPTALRTRRLCSYLQDHIADVLDYPEGERPHTDSGFFDLGMSSIHLAQVRQSVITDTGFEPSETSAFDHPTIAEFAAYLARELGSESDAAPTASDRPLLLHTLGQDDIDRLSAHDLERALVEVLS